MVYENKRPDVAVFIDFENVYVSVRDKLDATPNFESIMDRCDDLGRVVIARAYADWYRYPRITSALYANGIEPMYVPTYYYDKEMGRTGRAIKNSVDMNLCIDAMKTLFTNKNIDKFVLATGDRDFIPLVNSIRQQGKEVIIIGIGGAASTHLAQSADEFIFYEQLIGKSTAPPATTNGRQRGRDYPVRSGGSSGAAEDVKSSEVVPAAEPDIYDVLVDAVHLVRKRGYVSTLGSLKLVMKELMGGDFKESRYRDTNGRPFAKFKDFVVDAERRGRVMIFTSGTVNEVFLPGEDPQKLSQFAADFKEEGVEVCIEPEATPPVSTSHATEQFPPDTTVRSSSTSRRRRRRSRKSAPAETDTAEDQTNDETPELEERDPAMVERLDYPDTSAEIADTPAYAHDASLLDLAALSEAAHALFADIAAEQSMADERMAANAEKFFQTDSSDRFEPVALPELLAVDETMLFNIAEALALAADSEFVAAPLVFDSLASDEPAPGDEDHATGMGDMDDAGLPGQAESYVEPEYATDVWAAAVLPDAEPATDVAAPLEQLESSTEPGNTYDLWAAAVLPENAPFDVSLPEQVEHGQPEEVSHLADETTLAESLPSDATTPDQPEHGGEPDHTHDIAGQEWQPAPADAPFDQAEVASEPEHVHDPAIEETFAETHTASDVPPAQPEHVRAMDSDSGSEDSDAEEQSGEELHVTFSDEEWQAFQHMMADFTKPVSFANIFDSLRELRKQETLTRTNEHLRTMVKQAISNGLLERSGRGKRVYYKLKLSDQEQMPESTAYSESQD